ncbi:MAG: hypothetical protein C0599_06775 [Salinivirgaceae bacterium]|nr:MAG: hypothetical protein C0599_06775 [Salinivirgaceae bacterium]
MIQVEKINSLWLKAGIIGSSWAAFEIIVGSFLHNLQIPFAGTMLSAASVFLLISFAQLWNERGVILRAGIICALMKSISPSAVIIGPMVGIFMEALLLEFLILIMGRHMIGYIIAGSIAVLWSLIQKILFLLLMYGLDLVELAKSLYQYLIKISGIDSFSSMYFIAGIVLLYLVLGAIAAYAGYVSGKRYLNSKEKYQYILKVNLSQRNAFQSNTAQQFSVLLLFLVIGAIVASLYFVNKQMYWAAGGLGISFIVFCIYRYKNSTKYLRKPKIWIQFILITTIAAMIWGWASTGSYFSKEGLIVGLEMNYRAIIIIFGFAAVGVELRNPVVKAILFRRGFKQLHQTLSFSFAALPAIIESLPKPALFFKQRNRVMAQILNQSQHIIQSIDNE